MFNIQRLPDSELEIMMVIWDANTPVTSDYIMENLNKNWAKSTLLNFLYRLCERGFLKCHKEGKFNVYITHINKDDYLKKESKSFLKKLHDNSIASLVASLYDGESITKEDLNQLKKFIEGAK